MHRNRSPPAHFPLKGALGNVCRKPTLPLWLRITARKLECRLHHKSDLFCCITVIRIFRIILLHKGRPHRAGGMEDDECHSTVVSGSTASQNRLEEHSRT